MEPKQPGNDQMPDFNHLNDRIIAENPTEPMLVIKTNLDPKDSIENNPYNHEIKDLKKFKKFFQDKNSQG